MRGWIGTAIAFATTYYLVEIFGSVALLIWLGTGFEIFRLLGWHLAGLLLRYVAAGAIAGAVVGAVFHLSPAPPALARPLGRAAVIASLFASVALVWNPESYFPRRLYVLQTASALALVAGALGLNWMGSRLARRLHLRMPPLPRRASGVALIAGALALAGFLSLPTRSARSAAPAAVIGGNRPNVLLVVLDTVRPDHLSAYGYRRPTSPWVDRMAAEGALFEQAFSTSSWTLPAHVSMFTGRPVATHQTDSTHVELPQAYETVAELARARGYRTALFSANAWVSSMTALDQGFERAQFAGERTLTGASFVSLAIERARVMLGGGDADAGAPSVTGRAIDWIHRAADARTPFFVVANYMEAHEPYGTVPKAHATRFLSEEVSPTASRVWVRDTPLFLCSSCDPAAEPPDGIVCNAGRWRVLPERAERAAALYDGSLRFLDDQIGRLYRAMEERHVLNDTVVMITSDHGESLGEHGRMGHGGFLTNTLLRVPLIVRAPARFAAGVRVRFPVSHLDLYPTMRDVLGYPRDAEAPGTSLSDVPAIEKRPVRILAEYHPVPERVSRGAGKRLNCDYSLTSRRAASLQDERFKYVWSSNGEEELYDVIADPGETVSVIDRHQAETARLKRELHTLLAAFERRRLDRPERSLDPATRDLLRSLGYVR